MNFEEALKNEDLQKIMTKAASRFSNQLDPDELMTCKLNALWKATENHNEAKSKLSTYLFNGVRQQCISAVKFNNKHRKKTQPLHDNLEDHKASGNVIDLYDEIESLPTPDMLKDRMNNRTIQEVAVKHNCNRETARRKIKNSTDLLKSRLK